MPLRNHHAGSLLDARAHKLRSSAIHSYYTTYEGHSLRTKKSRIASTRNILAKTSHNLYISASCNPCKKNTKFPLPIGQNSFVNSNQTRMVLQVRRKSAMPPATINKICVDHVTPVPVDDPQRSGISVTQMRRPCQADQVKMSSYLPTANSRTLPPVQTLVTSLPCIVSENRSIRPEYRVMRHKILGDKCGDNTTNYGISC